MGVRVLACAAIAAQKKNRGPDEGDGSHGAGMISPIAVLAATHVQRRQRLRRDTAVRMPEYVIEREIPNVGGLSEDEIRDVSVRSLTF